MTTIGTVERRVVGDKASVSQRAYDRARQLRRLADPPAYPAQAPAPRSAAPSGSAPLWERRQWLEKMARKAGYCPTLWTLPRLKPEHHRDYQRWPHGR